MGEGNLENKIADYVMKNKEDIYRLAFSYVRNADDALDIVQESICKAISAKNSLKNPHYIKTWFYRIVVNTSLDLLRKQKKLVAVGEEILSGYDIEANDDYQDIDLQRALTNLPESYRSVVVLRFFEDLKIEEIAEVLNTNVNTVKTHLYKALAKLSIEMND